MSDQLPPGVRIAMIDAEATLTKTSDGYCLAYDGVKITLCRAERDKVRVIFIDGPYADRADDAVEDANGPIMRVHLNDEPIYENPPFPAEEETNDD